MARPKKKVDGEQVRKLAALGCTYAEIGAWFRVSGDTISRRFAAEFALGAENLKTSLRRMQWKSARGGSVPMQIHLGKQYLGQSDKVETRTTAGIQLEWPDDRSGDDRNAPDAPGPGGSPEAPGTVQGAGVRPSVGQDPAGGGPLPGDGA